MSHEPEIEQNLRALRSRVATQENEIKHLRLEIARLRKALEDIAFTDYRGNRSTESSIAFAALNK